MEQDNIYRVLLELKETTGRTEAKLEDIKESLVEQSISHDKLRIEHNELKQSHSTLKGKVLWVSGIVGALFGAVATWFKTTFLGNQ